MEAMREYKVACSIMMKGTGRVYARSAVEAIKLAKEMDYPKRCEPIEDTFKVLDNEDTMEEI